MAPWAEGKGKEALGRGGAAPVPPVSGGEAGGVSGPSLADEVKAVSLMLGALKGTAGSEARVKALEDELARLREAQLAERPLEARLRSATDRVASRRAAHLAAVAQVKTVRESLVAAEAEAKATEEASFDAERALVAVQDEWRASEGSAAVEPEMKPTVPMSLVGLVEGLRAFISAYPPGAFAGDTLNALEHGFGGLLAGHQEGEPASAPTSPPMPMPGRGRSDSGGVRSRSPHPGRKGGSASKGAGEGGDDLMEITDHGTGAEASEAVKGAQSLGQADSGSAGA